MTMDMLLKIIKERNKGFYHIKNDDIILKKCSQWIDEINKKYTGVERDFLLSQVYLEHAYYNFDFEATQMACEHFEKIPEEYMSSSMIIDYVDALKMCYEFEKAIKVLKKVWMLLEKGYWFIMEYWCLNELADYSMVADGAMEMEEYMYYKNKLKEFLKSKMDGLERMNP